LLRSSASRIPGLPVLAFAAVLVALLIAAGLASASTTSSPDTAGDVGQYSSMALDASGHPVVAYYDVTNGDLKVLHCGSADCATGNSITAPDTGGDVGSHPSMVLDSGGFPVISYHDSTNNAAKLMHCNDANCAGNDESISGVVMLDTFNASSLKLDASGYPAIVFTEPGFGGLFVVHCNDANCAGNDETTEITDLGGAESDFPSLALDSGGFPVIAYYDATSGDLMLTKCGSSWCSFPTLRHVDTVGDVGLYPSLALDGSGFPVVSYYDSSNGDLKVLHCGNAACTAGNSFTAPDPDPDSDVGKYSSMVLDASGYPVISYYDATSLDLKLMHCDDADCAGGGESITVADSTGDVGLYTSLALDAGGFPVASYYDNTNGDLKVLHCTDCAAPTATATDTPVPAATNTAVPGATNTPAPTNTAVPGATNTPAPTATNTHVPGGGAHADTATPAATLTPAATATLPATATSTPAPDASGAPTLGEPPLAGGVRGDEIPGGGVRGDSVGRAAGGLPNTGTGQGAAPDGNAPALPLALLFAGAIAMGVGIRLRPARRR